jgi:hypothetical protein
MINHAGPAGAAVALRSEIEIFASQQACEKGRHDPQAALRMA